MQQSLSTTQYDSSLISELASLLRTNFTSDEIQAAADKYLITPWPKEYVNSDTGRTYRPHHSIESAVVYSDVKKHVLIAGGEGGGKSVAGIVKTLERLRKGMSGSMACVAAETLIDGIPIAERTQPGMVNTAMGSAWASPSFCEGKADLFRVVTQRGDRVLATSDHRFLTPTGWRQLRDLRVGSLIAVDDNKHAQSRNEISPSSQADYCLGLHPCDECAIFLEQCDLSKWLQLAWLWMYFDHAFLLPYRAYIGSSACLTYHDVLSVVCQLLSEVDEHDYSEDYVSHTVHQSASHLGSLLAWRHYQHFLYEDNAEGTVIDQHLSQQYLPMRLSNQPYQQFLAAQALGHKVQLSSHDQNFLGDQFLSCSNHIITFQEVQEIKFERYGDFYGMIVPGPANYIANGIIHHNSPDLEHFKKSLWPEFKRWCPWHRVIERHQYMAEPGWLPREYFEVVFRNDLGGYSTLGCGGCPEVDTKKWEGPNISFVHLDEIRRHKTAAALKVFTGRVRITGPHGEPPQIYLTTTPLKHWLYDYFGPMDCTCSACHKSYLWDLAPNTLPVCPSCSSPLFTTNDPWRDFKLNATVIRLRTQDNEPNLYDGFARDRAMSLTEAEARVLLDAEWEDLADSEHFLPSITLWDLCYSSDIPPLSPNEPIVLAVDAAKGRTNDYSDCFAIVGVSRHWEKEKRRDHCVVRFVYTWQAKPGGKIELVADKSRNQPDGPEDVLRNLCSTYNITQIAYDPYQMNDLGQRFRNARIAWMKEFGQISERTESDSDLLQLILSRRIVHNNDSILREHIENADRKVSDDGNKIRIVKRLDSLKVDAAVALSMACKRCLYLNIA